MVAYRAITERRVVHIHDVAAVSGYAIEPIKLGQQRTSLGVPLLREGEPIGSILLARRGWNHLRTGKSNSSTPSPIRR